MCACVLALRLFSSIFYIFIVVAGVCKKSRPMGLWVSGLDLVLFCLALFLLLSFDFAFYLGGLY